MSAVRQSIDRTLATAGAPHLRDPSRDERGRTTRLEIAPTKNYTLSPTKGLFARAKLRSAAFGPVQLFHLVSFEYVRAP
jgi:hypothetical protein